MWVRIDRFECEFRWAGGVHSAAQAGVGADPAALQVRDEAGNSRPARSSDYTHIRWSLRNPIGPGQVAMARYRAALK